MAAPISGSCVATSDSAAVRRDTVTQADIALNAPYTLSVKLGHFTV